MGLERDGLRWSGLSAWLRYLALGAREPWEVEERDAKDPVPWAKRAEAAKRRHANGLSSSDVSRQALGGDE